jgi:Phosphoesterase family
MSFRFERVFDRVLVLMFENQYRSYVLQNAFFRRLADQGIELGNYNGVMHPSQTNYIAAVAGELCGVTEDDPPPALLGQRTIVDLLEEAPGQLRWKGYMESFDPAANRWSCTLTPADACPYYVKHNPFGSFEGIVRVQQRWERIDSEAGFFADVLNNDLPEFAWFTPNIWSDGHWLDGTQEESKPRAPKLVDQQARWLSAFFQRLNFPGPKSHLPKGTLVVVTFDESDFEATWTAGKVSTYDGPNQIYTVLLGDMLKPAFREEGYNHYSLLRTIEQNFNLDSLGKNDFGANWFQFLWGREFRWEPAPPSPFTGAGSMAAAGFHGALYVAQVTDTKTITCRTYAEGRWSAPVVLSVANVASISLASTFTTLVMALRLADGSVVAMTYDDQAGWSVPGEVDPGPVDSLVLQSIAHESALMLVTAGTAGVTSRVWRHRAWCPVTPVPGLGGQLDLALATLGPSAYLIARPREGSTLQVATYNTAEYNAVAVASGPYGGPQDDTTVNTWSADTLPVGHFLSHPEASGERQPGFRKLLARGPLAAATMDGVLHLVHIGVSNTVLLTETLSIPGLLTPKNPISYDLELRATHSNGFGTLAEASWTPQVPIHGSRCGAGAPLAMGRAGDQLLLLAGPPDGGAVELWVGQYSHDHR